MGMGELMASYTFAQKKTMKSMTVAYEQLLGAAVMNNTYCLFIFLILIATQGLYWNYSFPTCLTCVIILVKFNSIHFSIIKSHFFSNYNSKMKINVDQFSNQHSIQFRF